jgi:hypothetical protein
MSTFWINADSLTGSSINVPFESSRDELVNTYSFFNENGGIYPTDIAYAQNNEIFVYGQRAIKVFDATSNALLDEIDISAFGHLQITNCKFIGNRFHDYRMLYTNDRIFCVTEGLELLMIDANTHAIIDVQPRPNCIGESEKIANMILKHNISDNRLYWIINEYDNDSFFNGEDSGGNVAIYEIISNSNLNLLEQITYSGYIEQPEENFIRDIEFDPISSHFYVSVNHEIKKYNSNTFNEVDSFQTIHYAGLLEIVNDGSIHKLICSPNYDVDITQNAYINIIDLDTNNYLSLNTNFPHTYATCIDYANQRIYIASRSEVDYFVMSLDYVNNTLNESFYELNHGTYQYELLYIESTENLFICTSSGVEIVDCYNISPIMINEYHDNNSRYNIENGNNKIWIVNLEGCTFEEYDLNGTMNNSVHIGEEAYKGIVSEQTDQIFLFKFLGERLSIFNISSQTMEFFELPGKIIELTIDDENNELYVLCNIGCSSGDIICYSLPNMIQNGIYEMNNNGHFGFSTLMTVHYFNGYLYAGGPEGIDIWDLGRPNNHISFSNYYAYDFVTDFQNQRVFAISGFVNSNFANPGGNNILILSGFDDPISYQIPNNRNEFAFDIENEKIYFVGLEGNNEYLYSLDILTGQYTPIFNTENELLMYVQYSYERNELYVSSIDKSFEYCKLYIFDLEGTVLIDTIDLPMLSTQMFFNDYNNKLYVLNLHDWAEDFEMNMISVEVENNNTLTRMPLTFKERPKGGSRINLFGLKGCKSILPHNDRLFVVRGNNVLQEIACFPTETKTLSTGWNWESFPRLERDATINEGEDIIPILETIEPFNDVSLIDFVTNEHNLTYNINNNPLWQPFQNYDIQSTWLYKMDINPEAERILELYGSRMQEDYVIEDTFESGVYHWFGYWLPETLNMDDAFGGFWDRVLIVKAEEWTYWRDSQPRGDPTNPEPLPSSKIRPLEYGKGYMVKFEEEVENFHWNYSGLSVEGYERPVSENFIYEEKPDYEVIDVINIPEIVIEIGVFQDSICVGAVVIEDSCAQILVYSESANRDPLPFNFEVVTGRSSNSPILNYEVLNFNTGKFEKDLLISGCQEYSVVKLGEQGEQEEEIPVITKPKLYSNYPNPFNPTTTISFSVPREEDIELTIYNIKGQKVKTLYSGIAEEGKHSMIWNGKNTNNKSVSSGIYFYKLKTNNKVLTCKMLMMK